MRECGEVMTDLKSCKLNHPKDFQRACSQDALKLANCAAEKFCMEALNALRKR